MTTKNTKVRIAPSPTGKMHIGTARTALFNKLFALANNGEYCVRIEDTDAERSTPENITLIKDAFQWLNLEPDTTYIRQTDNINAHKTAAQKLLSEGKAYLDEGALRFKIPTGETTWQDQIQGQITYQHDTLEDFVILRSNGTPTYHLGVVVDDATMGITHVIRGDDHINNTPKQILLHQALGNTVPTFAHVPLIHGEDGKKLSKRHGATSVQEFRDDHILPAALIHYLMQLSWLPGDHTQPLTLQEAAKTFKLTDITKGAARFDTKKLNNLNSQYIKNLSLADLHAALNITPTDITQKALPALQKKAKTLTDIPQGLAPFTAEPPFTYTDEQEEILANGQKILFAITEFLKAEADWSTENLDSLIKAFINENNLKFPDVGKPLRLTLTGETFGLGLGETLNILGKETSLKRLNS